MSKNSGKVMFAGLLGALAGAVGGILFAPKSGKKTRDDILRLANMVADELKTGAKDTEKKAKEVFGKVSEQAVEKYEEIRIAVADKVAAVKSAGEEIDKDKYASIVEDVVKEFKDELEATKGNYSKLVSMLKNDWDKVKKVVVEEVLSAKPKKKTSKK